jgi:hypothetical protein
MSCIRLTTASLLKGANTVENISMQGWEVALDGITCPISKMDETMGYGVAKAEFVHKFMKNKYVIISVVLVRAVDVRFEVVYGDRRYAPQSFRMTAIKGRHSFKEVVEDALRTVNNNI